MLLNKWKELKIFSYVCTVWNLRLRFHITNHEELSGNNDNDFIKFPDNPASFVIQTV